MTTTKTPWIVVLFFAAGVPGQCALVTPLEVNGAAAGMMFDLEATGGSPVTITNFAAIPATGGAPIPTVEVWVTTSGTTWVGQSANPGAWTLIATGGPVPFQGIETLVDLGLGFAYTLQPGTRTGFYVTSTGTGSLRRRSGTQVGNVFASDAQLTIYEGAAVSYPFGFPFQPRKLPCAIEYVCGQPAPAYQVNQPGASYDINGSMGTATLPSFVGLYSGTVGVLTLTSTNLGQLWDLGLTAGPLVPAGQGALSTPSGQLVNLDVTDPTLFLLWNGLQSPPFANITTSFMAPGPGATSAQMVIADPAQPSGLSFSQPLRLTVSL